eukprot:scaffold125759_cov29-Tisochrysis_lutea.AAC.1
MPRTGSQSERLRSHTWASARGATRGARVGLVRLIYRGRVPGSGGKEAERGLRWEGKEPEEAGSGGALRGLPRGGKRGADAGNWHSKIN